MVIDPKLAAGGVGVVAIGGGAGYAISKSVNSSNENSQSTQQISTKDGDENKDVLKNKETNKTAIEKAGFTIAEGDENEGDCKTKLEGKVLSTEDEFKKAVIACVKGKKFADKAEKLGLDVIKSNAEDDWISEWETYKSKVKTIITEIESKSDWKSSKTDVINFCTNSGTNKGNKDINNDTTDENWKKFLKACTKDKGTKTVSTIEGNNFWTNKPITQVAA